LQIFLFPPIFLFPQIFLFLSRDYAVSPHSRGDQCGESNWTYWHTSAMHDPLPQHRLKLANIARSVSVIPPEFLHSPQYECEALSAALGCRLTIKLDFTNPIRSFKARGASFLMHEMQRHDDLHCLESTGIVCASAGNWGQALAYLCRAQQIPITIFASVRASPLKIERMRAFGARVQLAGIDFDAAKDAAKNYASCTGARMAEDGLDAAISEGHGSLAIELLARADRFDAIAVPLGNGALLNGVARWCKAATPHTQVIGVSATGADAMAQSWREQKLVIRSSANTIADGIAVRVPIAQALEDMQGIVDAVLLVDELHIVEAMQLVYQHAGLMLEPAGAVGVAAILARRTQFADQRVATVLCGSNITADQFAATLSSNAALFL
jgi:threonine dehydratase